VSLLDVDAAQDSVASLEAKGWVGRAADGQLELTAIGTQQNAELGAVARGAEADKLKGFSAAEINTARQVLAAFGGHLGNTPVYREER
jgi:hypothetical protein